MLYFQRELFNSSNIKEMIPEVVVGQGLAKNLTSWIADQPEFERNAFGNNLNE